MSNLNGIKSLLSSPQDIAIIAHARPDGDAIGSALGLHHFLVGRGHRSTVVMPNGYADFLRWLPGDEQVVDHSRQAAKAVAALENASLIFCLDFNDPRRIEALQGHLTRAGAVKMMIDHHREPTAFTEYKLWDQNVSSTAELVYRFIEIMDGIDEISRDVAVCLYVGVLTDTGSFKYSNTTLYTHQVAGRLIDHGVDPASVYDAIYNQFSADRLRFFGHCLSSKMQVFPEFHTALISVTKEELEQFKVKTGDTEGLVNFPLTMKGIVFSALIIDRTSMVKLSLRSKGEFDVAEFSRLHFNGGGHMNASGGASKESLEKVVEKFKNLLPESQGLKTQNHLV